MKLPQELAGLNLTAEVLRYFAKQSEHPHPGHGLKGFDPELSLWGHQQGRHLQNLYLFESLTELLCFCHFRPFLLLTGRSAGFACNDQWSAAGLKVLLRNFPLAKVHLCFPGDLCGRVLDCVMAAWSKDKLAEFHYSEGYVVIYFQGKQFKVHEQDFSMSRFERLTGIRSGLRTHKPASGHSSWLSLKKSIDNSNLIQL